MTNQQILTEATQKAIDGGWQAPDKKFHVSEWGPVEDGSMLDNPTVKLAVFFDTASSALNGSIYHASDLIFNHAFAKALWGDKFINPELRHDNGSKVIAMTQTGWKHHLRQMVIADDPIKYLGENL